MESVDPDKYVVFKRDEFFQMMGQLALPPWPDGKGGDLGGDVDCAPLSEMIGKHVSETELHDAVVIRRQDLFAGPALHTYSNSMAMTVRMVGELQGGDQSAKRLQGIADYFHEQAVLADEEAWKLPD